MAASSDTTNSMLWRRPQGDHSTERSRTHATLVIGRIVDARALVVWTVRRIGANERRVDVARRDEHAPDMVGGVRGRGGAGQSHQAGLGGAIGRTAGASAHRGQRAEVDDHPTASPAHRRHDCLRSEEITGQDRIQDHPPHLFGLIVERDAEIGSGVVDQGGHRPTRVRSRRRRHSTARTGERPVPHAMAWPPPARIRAATTSALSTNRSATHTARLRARTTRTGRRPWRRLRR